MNWLKTIRDEILGLFIDDQSFALAIVVWLAAVWLLASRVPAVHPWSGVLLFAGLAVILLESTIRRARK